MYVIHTCIHLIVGPNSVEIVLLEKLSAENVCLSACEYESTDTSNALTSVVSFIFGLGTLSTDQ